MRAGSARAVRSVARERRRRTSTPNEGYMNASDGSVARYQTTPRRESFCFSALNNTVRTSECRGPSLRKERLLRMTEVFGAYGKECSNTKKRLASAYKARSAQVLRYAKKASLRMTRVFGVTGRRVKARSTNVQRPSSLSRPYRDCKRGPSTLPNLPRHPPGSRPETDRNG